MIGPQYQEAVGMDPPRETGPPSTLGVSSEVKISLRPATAPRFPLEWLEADNREQPTRRVAWELLPSGRVRLHRKAWMMVGAIWLAGAMMGVAVTVGVMSQWGPPSKAHQALMAEQLAHSAGYRALFFQPCN